MAETFRDQVVWITGGGTGIGRSLAEALAAQGAKVVVSGRRQQPLAETVDAIAGRGGIALAKVCDVADTPTVDRTVREIVDLYGRLDMVIANAGFAVAGTIESLEIDDWRRQFDVNVFGLVATVKAALPELKKVNGRVVLIGSVSAYLATKRMGPYSASKFAVRAIGASLSRDLEGTGVTCTTVHPGYVESQIGQVDNEGNYDASVEDRRPKKLMWSSEDAATAIIRASTKRKREVVFTGHGKFAVFMARHLPAVARKLG